MIKVIFLSISAQLFFSLLQYFNLSFGSAIVWPICNLRRKSVAVNTFHSNISQIHVGNDRCALTHKISSMFSKQYTMRQVN